MYFGLSEEQESIQDFVKKFLADNSTVDEIRKIANGEGEELEKNIFEGILSLGINTLLIPEKHNGLGAGLLHAVAVAQALGSGVGPIPFVGSYVMAPIAINLGGNEEQKNNYLPKIANNEIRFGVGMTEFVGAREDAGIEFSKNKLSKTKYFEAKVYKHKNKYLLIKNKKFNFLKNLVIFPMNEINKEKFQLSIDKKINIKLSNMNMKIIINENNNKKRIENSFLLDKSNFSKFILPSFTKKIFNSLSHLK